MIHRIAPLALVLACAALLAACETPLDRAWGVSQGEHVARSIANPDAGSEDLEAPRTDGPSTGAALHRHREHEASAEQAQPESVINIDIGG